MSTPCRMIQFPRRLRKHRILGRSLLDSMRSKEEGLRPVKQDLTTDVEPRRDFGAQSLLREDQGPVALLTLNRPEARNPLSEDLIAALHAAIVEIGGSDAVRAIVITGAGQAFSSGHDLKEMTAHRSDPDRGLAYFAKIMKACSEMMLAIVRSPKPVIAAVNGIATAAGCKLVA